jgi:hypothetical protein
MLFVKAVRALARIAIQDAAERIVCDDAKCNLVQHMQKLPEFVALVESYRSVRSGLEAQRPKDVWTMVNTILSNQINGPNGGALSLSRSTHFCSTLHTTLPYLYLYLACVSSRCEFGATGSCCCADPAPSAPAVRAPASAPAAKTTKPVAYSTTELQDLLKSDTRDGIKTFSDVSV